MAKTPAPDPRFDPRFQRGYDGPEPPLPQAPAAPLRSEQADQVPPDVDGAPQASDSPDVPEFDEVWAPHRRNPFALALLVGGLAMIAVGTWLLWSVVTESSFPNGYDQAQQAFALIQQQVTPALLICGVLGIVGWLMLGALAASARKDD